jgi:RNA polymerase sigma-70 factor, ECF subfamily
MTAAQDFGAAFTAGDVDALARLLREDVALELPPRGAWYSGRDAITELLRAHLAPGIFRLVPVAANGQPAFAVYKRAAGWTFRAHSIIVLTMRGPAIARITVFQHPRLFEKFGLPTECLPPAARAAREFPQT